MLAPNWMFSIIRERDQKVPKFIKPSDHSNSQQTSPCSQKEKERIGILDEIFWVQGVSFLGSGIHLKKGEDLHTICALGPENTEITFWLSEHFHFSIAVQHLFILICTMYLVVQSNGHLRMFICVGQCNFTSSPT